MKTWILAVVLAGTGIAVHALRSESGASQGTSRPERAQTQAAPGPREAARPAVRQHVPVRVPIAAGAAAGGAEDTEPAGAADTPLPAPEPAEIRDRLEAIFYAERVDPAWGHGAARGLEHGIAALLPTGSSLRGVECRDSLCRIETAHATIEQFRELVQRAFLLAETRISDSAFFAAPVGEPTPGQPVAIVLYLAREGRAMPGPEQLVP